MEIINSFHPHSFPCRPAGPSQGEGEGGGITQALSSMNIFRLFKKEDQVKNQNGSQSLEKILGHFTDLVKENNETLEWTDLPFPCTSGGGPPTFSASAVSAAPRSIRTPSRQAAPGMCFFRSWMSLRTCS